VANWISNIAKGRFAYYATLPATNDALIIVVLEAAGLEADATLKDYDTLAALLAGTTNEQTTMGRKTATGVTVTVNDATDLVDVDMDDLTWTAASGNAVGALLVCYDPDTTAGTDADLIPLSKHDFTITPDGVNNVVATIGVNGFARATE
jgi:hypothetical protein